MMKLLVAMPWGRVGSNLLIQMLLDSFRSNRVSLENEPLKRSMAEEEKIQWADKFFSEEIATDALKGMKTKLHGIGLLDDLAGILEYHKVRVIRMRRSNLVEVAVSILRAKRYAEVTKARSRNPEWGVRKGKEPLPPIELDPEEFVRALRLASRSDRTLTSFEPDCPIYDLEYREFCENVEGHAGKVIDWLGLVPDQRASPRFIKATPNDLNVAVPNLRELKIAAQKAGLLEFEEMFEA